VVRSDDISVVIARMPAGDRVSEISLDKPGEYTLTYSCIGLNGIAAKHTVRKVLVRDTTCPWCALRTGPSTVEASFPFSDPGIDCTDAVDGQIDKSHVTVTGFTDVEKVGTYFLTYRVRDSSGNWNDGSVDERIGGRIGVAEHHCIGRHFYVRTVKVVDTLKPVIAMKFGGKIFHVTGAAEASQAESGPSTNPAANYFVRSDGSLGGASTAATSFMEHSLMADRAYHGSSVVAFGAGVGLMALGVIVLLVGSGGRRREGGGACPYPSPTADMVSV
jgi:hypothetical protein